MREFEGGSKRDDLRERPQVERPFWKAFFATWRVHKHGDDHYGPGNWVEGQPFDQVFASTQRHLVAWFTKEDRDGGRNGSGLPHLLHAAWGVLYLVHMAVVHPKKYEKFDNREDR